MPSPSHQAEPNATSHRLAAIAQCHHPEFHQRRLTLLHFGGEDGCTARDLAALPDFAVTAADTHEAATMGQQQMPQLRIPATPEELLTSRFDVIAVTDFFCRTPDALFARWLAALYYNLQRNGLLVFATAGRAVHQSAGTPFLEREGFRFAHENAGRMIVTPAYVIDRIDECPNAELVRYESGGWNHARDLWIVRKTGSHFARRALPQHQGLLEQIAALEAARETMRASTSWRLTAPLRAAGHLFASWKPPR